MCMYRHICRNTHGKLPWVFTQTERQGKNLINKNYCAKFLPMVYSFHFKLFNENFLDFLELLSDYNGRSRKTSISIQMEMLFLLINLLFRSYSGRRKKVVLSTNIKGGKKTMEDLFSSNSSIYWWNISAFLKKK